ncbi:hypothetical protein, partial [Burkholderia mallei]|uniref:hypothetical protein n=1 Tax=Burkholderia mallei TaxID=13373 RepID=UPI001E4BDCD6
MYEAGIALTSGAQKRPALGMRAGGKRKAGVRKRSPGRAKAAASPRPRQAVTCGPRRLRAATARLRRPKAKRAAHAARFVATDGAQPEAAPRRNRPPAGAAYGFR